MGSSCDCDGPQILIDFFLRKKAIIHLGSFIGFTYKNKKEKKLKKLFVTF
jgi:hypothetical protein